MKINLRKLTILFFIISLAFSCSKADKMRANLKQLKRDLNKAKKASSERCAGREVARSEANLVFALNELEDGDYLRANRHFLEAKSGTKMALALARQCKPEEKEFPDSDKDGLQDHVDACPQEPEDYDGFQDEDGCPEDQEKDTDRDMIPDIFDRCPLVAGIPEKQGCPAGDRDKDKVPDNKDLCPDKPEDLDGFMDEDGCPDIDNDQDGVLDVDDHCPNVEGVAEHNGCPPPKYKMIIINKKSKKIELKQKVFFNTGKATIKSISHGLLNEVGAALKDNKGMKVLIEGHTDSVGSDSYNMILSDKRAKAVRAYLIEQGIAPDRVEAIGFGETKPISSNNTATGREKNRRVEFRIIAQ